jgi:hypothetical protein
LDAGKKNTLNLLKGFFCFFGIIERAQRLKDMRNLCSIKDKIIFENTENIVKFDVIS